MIAVDTNVLVRYLVADDVAQADRAEAVLRGGAVFVPKTVLLETAWVLRSSYRFERAAIASALTRLLGLPGVAVEDGPAVARALAWYGQGLDFADALHLVSSERAEGFATLGDSLRHKARAVADALPIVAS